MINDGRRDCVHGFRWCAQCCWSGGRSTKEFLAGVASPPPSTVPGDQGGERRRPQVGGAIEVAYLAGGSGWLRIKPGLPADWRAKRVLVREAGATTIGSGDSAEDGVDGYVHDSDEGIAWRWPATQGAAVAGPARECPLPCVLPPGHEGLHRLAPPPPASEPHPYAAAPSGACVCCGQRRCCHDIAAATAAKAALEVQLRYERASHAATEDWRLKLMDAWERVCQAAQVDPDSTTDHVVAVVAILFSGRAHATSNEQALTALIGPLRQRALERDALAAQLNAVLPLLVPVDNGYRRCLRCNTHSHQSDVHRHVDGCEVRAALAASGPGEGT